MVRIACCASIWATMSRNALPIALNMFAKACSTVRVPVTMSSTAEDMMLLNPLARADWTPESFSEQAVDLKLLFPLLGGRKSSSSNCSLSSFLRVKRAPSLLAFSDLPSLHLFVFLYLTPLMISWSSICCSKLRRRVRSRHRQRGWLAVVERACVVLGFFPSF